MVHVVELLRVQGILPEPDADCVKDHVPGYDALPHDGDVEAQQRGGIDRHQRVAALPSSAVT